MVDICNDNRLVSLTSRPGIRNLLTTLLDQLQRCQKSLNEFLEVSEYYFRVKERETKTVVCLKVCLGPCQFTKAINYLQKVLS